MGEKGKNTFLKNVECLVPPSQSMLWLTSVCVLSQVLMATWSVYLTISCALRTQCWWTCIRGCIHTGPTTPMSPPLCPGSRESRHRPSVTSTWSRGRKLWTECIGSITWRWLPVSQDTLILILCALIDN